MKRFISILLILPLSILGQSNLDTARIKIKHNFATQPAYFLDSVDININKTYIDLENIESIKVSKDTFSDNGVAKIGKVFITSKNKIHTWASLGEIKILKSTTEDTTQPKVYIIDGNLISDTANVRIELSFIKSIEILNMADTKEIYHEGPTKTVIVITTKQKHKKHRTKNSR